MRLRILILIGVGISLPGAATESSIDIVGARAAAGEPAAMVELGLAYRDAGLPGVAADWFCKAAESNDPDANFWCGRSLLHGFGRPRDEHSGRSHLERAADKGSAAAALLLGERTTGEESEQWFGIAGRMGSPEGDYRLGLLLDRRGRQDAAIDAYSRAADRDYGPALNALGIVLLKGTDGDAAARARGAFVRGAELGDQSARLNAGILISKEDPAAAFRYLSLAIFGSNRQIRQAAAEMRQRVSLSLNSSETERLEKLVASEIEVSLKRAQPRIGASD